jgi:KDO2-lipid IV(A) lauroyltransferase
MLKKIKHSLLRPVASVVDISMLSLIYLTRGLAYVLPVKLLYAIFTYIGYVLYYIVPGARQRLFSTISECMPQLTDDEVRHIARSSYGELMRPMVDFPVFLRHGERLLDQLVEEGYDVMDELDARGKGVIVLTPHVGGWDMATAIMNHYGFEVAPILVNPDATLTPRAVRGVEALGAKLGSDSEVSYFIPGGDMVTRATDFIRKGRRLGLTPDVEGKRIVEYFGHPAAVADGTGHFACDTGAAIALGIVVRDEWGVPCRAYIGYPIEYELTGDCETDITNIMQAVFSAIEREIRKIPDQYTQWGAVGRWWKKAEELTKSAP